MGLLNFFKKSLSSSQEKIENSPLSITTIHRKKLSAPEIEFLKYLSNHDTDIGTFKKHFAYEYNLDYKSTVNTLIENNYMCIGSAKESLIVNTTSNLKFFLKLKGLSISGKKEDLIKRILEQTTDYDTYFKKRIFILTEKGQNIINEYETAILNDIKKKVADTIFYIKNGQFQQLVPLYQTSADKKNPLSIGYDKDNIIKDACAIDEWRKMSHDNERELTIAIILIMCGYVHGNNSIFKGLGYSDVSESEIYTISTSIHSLRQIAECKELGIKKYEILSCGDERVCDKCSKHNGKKYFVNKAILGKTAPPFCEECRCVILSVFE